MSYLPIVPTQVTLSGNVGSLDTPRAAHLVTIDPRGHGNALTGSWMVSNNQQKIGEPNGMLDLLIVPTQLMLRGNVGSLNAPTIHIWPLGGRVMP